MIIFEVEVEEWDWENKFEKIEKTRLNRLRRKIEERLHQSYQSSSIYINLHQSEKYNKLRNSKLKNINRWNIHDYIKTHKGMLILAVKVKWWDWKKIEMIDKKDWKDWKNKIE